MRILQQINKVDKTMKDGKQPTVASPIEPVVMLPFHELSEKEFDEMKEEGKTWRDVMAKYHQPKWCDYPDALDGSMGCWRLVSMKITCKDDCETCDLIKAS